MESQIALFFIGFISGIFTGFFGVGGGFFLTPVLHILGMQIITAIGTSFFALIGKSLIGAWRHLKLGNGHLKLGTILGLASILGVECGKRFILHLENQNLAGPFIRITYIIILILISFFMLKESLSQTKRDGIDRERKETRAQEKRFLSRNIVLKIGLPPKITLSRSPLISVSLWIFIAVGVLIGFLSSLLGVGGGFVTLPFLIYGAGMPAIKAVGTSLITVFFTSSYGAFAYSATGHVNWTAGIVILAGSILGIQLGVAAVKRAAEMKIKILFAILLFCVALSVFLKQIELKIIGGYVVLSGAVGLCLIILFPVVSNFLAGVFRRKY